MWRALEFFQGISGVKKKLKSSFVLDYANLQLYSVTNSTPPWWCDELSRIFQAIKAMNGTLIDRPKKLKGGGVIK